MIVKNNKQIGLIYNKDTKIDKIIKNNEVLFEQGFINEKTSNTIPFSFDGIRKNLKNYKIYGNTFQDTISGKNFADFSNCQGYNYTNGVPSTPASKITINSKDSNNINFTYTNNSFLGVVGNIMDLEPNSQYIVSFKREQNNNFSQRLHILNVSINDEYSLNEAINSEAFGNPYSHTFTTGITGRIAIMISSNNSSPNGETENITEIMVRKDTTTSDYIPYVGGVSSPNPYFPQEINSCGNKSKNLLDKPASFTVERQTIDFSLKPGTYILSCESPENYRRLVFFRYKENTDNGVYVFFEPNSTSVEFTTNKEISKLNFYSRDGASSSKGNTTTYTNLMLRESSISDNTYEPYGYKISAMINGNNIYNVHGEPADGGWGGAVSPEVIRKDNDFISVTYNNTGLTDHYSNIMLKRADLLQPSTNYLLICEIKNVQGTGILYPFTKHNSSSIETQHSLYNFSNLHNGQMLIIPVITKSTLAAQDLRTLVRFNPGQNGTIIFRLSLILDTTITENTFKYSSYCNEKTIFYLKEPLRKINNIKDNTDFINQKIIRNIKKSILDTSTIELKSSYSNLEYAIIDKPNDFLGYNEYGNYPFFCSHATYSSNPSNWNSKGNIGKIFTGAQTQKWWIGFKKGTELEEIKKQLENCIFIYPLKNSIEESFIFPKILNAYGENIFNIDTMILPTQVYIQYKNDKKS